MADSGPDRSGHNRGGLEIVSRQRRLHRSGGMDATSLHSGDRLETNERIIRPATFQNRKTTRDRPLLVAPKLRAAASNPSPPNIRISPGRRFNAAASNSLRAQCNG